ncbi:MAG TPA: hypothetical protein VF532_06845 [Candidatus Angelobacter sp.]
MPLDNESMGHVDAVLQLLEAEKDQVQKQVAAGQARLQEINASIITVKSLNSTASSLQSLSSRPPQSKYANISVHWAILDFLHDSGAMFSASIADALKAAGVRTRAANFVNNVSAVLSTTMKEHNEVQFLPDGRWELTESGINKIEHIRTTPKFRRATGTW